MSHKPEHTDSNPDERRILVPGSSLNPAANSCAAPRCLLARWPPWAVVWRC